ncbi:UDP-N-acetylmuramoyl-L-alanine--D-glutamate ligase, partial [Chloroflexota bacterium]
IVGLAREGTALARYLTDRGAHVTVTDVKQAAELTGCLSVLNGRPIEYALGGHPLGLLDPTDIVYVSPGVPLEIPLLLEARNRRVPMSTETRLFANRCPAPIIAVTGSSGKTTTTALVGAILEAAGRKVWVGGNIGVPLLGHLEEIGCCDAVVMELSSFQLEFFAPSSAGESARGLEGVYSQEGWSPSIAGLLNITPNHLDRHASMAAYIDAKTQIVASQSKDDVAILGLDNEVTRRIGEAPGTESEIHWFSMEQPVREGAFLSGDRLILRSGGAEHVVCRTGDLRLIGRHNVENTLAAFALAGVVGAPTGAMLEVATSFAGVEHRLELLGERDGVRWYNDSIATTPERTVAALRAFQTPIVLLAGGRDKYLPWTEMATLTWDKVRHLILFGEAADLIEAEMHKTRPHADAVCQMDKVGTLEQAVEMAARSACPGDTVLLSPGGTSYDAFDDFVERGRRFRQLFQGLE